MRSTVCLTLKRNCLSYQKEFRLPKDWVIFIDHQEKICSARILHTLSKIKEDWGLSRHPQSADWKQLHSLLRQKVILVAFKSFDLMNNQFKWFSKPFVCLKYSTVPCKSICLFRSNVFFINPRKNSIYSIIMRQWITSPSIIFYFVIACNVWNRNFLTLSITVFFYFRGTVQQLMSNWRHYQGYC